MKKRTAEFATGLIGSILGDFLGIFSTLIQKMLLKNEKCIFMEKSP